MEEKLDMEAMFKAPDEVEDGITNKYSLRSWWNCIQAVPMKKYLEWAALYKWALHHLPGSYKLWFNFLEESWNYCIEYPITDDRFKMVNELHEGSLIYMHKMPWIWLDYAKFLGKQKLVWAIWSVYDRALSSLSLLQNKLIWGAYFEWADIIDSASLKKHLYERYVIYDPSSIEDYLNFLIEEAYVKEAAYLYLKMIQDPNFKSKWGDSKHSLWMQLCEILAKNPEIMPNAEEIIWHGLRKYSDEVGKLWIYLADYFSRLG